MINNRICENQLNQKPIEIDLKYGDKEVIHKMVIKLKPTKDPGLHDKDGKQTSVPISLPIDKRMKLRNLALKQFRNNKLENIVVKLIAPDRKLSPLVKMVVPKLEIDWHQVCERAHESIESVEKNKFFCIRKGANRMFCGGVIHRIPMGGCARRQWAVCLSAVASSQQRRHFQV